MHADDDQRPVKLGYEGDRVPHAIRWMWILGFLGALVYLLLL
jgi:hypothetical protein